MITMDQINDIRYLTKIQRLSYSKVKKITGCSYETIKKYEELEICAKEQQIDKKFLEMMKEKSEMIYWNTLKPYIERVMKKDS